MKSTAPLGILTILTAVLTFYATALIAPLPAFAEDEALSSESSKILVTSLIRHQKEAAKAQELVTQLRLSKKQARRLLPVINQAAAVHVEAYEKQAKLLPHMIEVYTEFARQDSLNEGFTPSIENETGRLHHVEIQLTDDTGSKLLALEQKAAQFLSVAQRKYAADFRSGFSSAEWLDGFKDRQRQARRAARRSKSTGPDPVDQAKATLHEIQRQKHPKPSPAGKLVLHPMSAGIIYSIAGKKPPQIVQQAADIYQNGTEQYPLAKCLEHRGERGRLGKEISNWNLINGLHFSEEQIDNIVGLADANMLNTHNTKQCCRCHKQMNCGSKIASLEQSVEQIMTVGQRQVMVDFAPCLLPPKNLKDPVRVGQARDNSAYVQMLERARTVPQRRVATFVDKAIERETTHHHGFSNDYWRQRRELLIDTMHAVRNMSEVDFELKKPTLAENITPPDLKQELKKGISAVNRTRGLPGQTAQLMLNPTFINQLRIRGEQLAAGVRTNMRPTGRTAMRGGD